MNSKRGGLAILALILFGALAWLAYQVTSARAPVVSEVTEPAHEPDHAVASALPSAGGSAGTENAPPKNPELGANGALGSAGGTGAPGNPAAGTTQQPPDVSAPSTQLLREEIARDAHHAPPSLMKFADSLAPRMEAALKAADEAPARALFNEMGACAREASVALQARALCMANARRLVSARGDSFKTDAARLEAEISPQVKELVDALNQLGKGTGGAGDSH